MTERERLIERCNKLGPECKDMIDAVLGQSDSFAHGTLDIFEKASDEDKADHLAFFDSGGPRMIHEAKTKHADGTPTSADLERWAE